MMSRIFILFVITIISLAGYSQVPAGRSNNTTLYETFCPADIFLKSGEVNHQAQANVFLKDASLVYMKAGAVKRASMNVIESVSFGKIRFVNTNNQLAEVVDTCNGNSLVCVKLIDKAAMEGEYLNNSIITSLNFGTDNLGTTRLDADPSVLKYPIVANYYIVTKTKSVVCQEREVRKLLTKAKRSDYDRFIASLHFNWANRTHLSELLYFLSK